MVVIFALALPPASGSDLIQIPGCIFVPTDWGDGDSFLVRTPAGEERTVRLYGADCFEWHVTDESDARRLRAQRRYFGITFHGGSSQESIRIAKDFGKAAYEEVAKQLAEPFTIHTSFSDARGDGKYERIYAFVVTAEGIDLASHLVSEGLARAFGVGRGTWDGRSLDEYRASLEDRELLAARRSLGAWAATDWENIANERMEQRMEDEEFALATGDLKIRDGEKVDPNEAARDRLMQLPGVGETLANRIIEGRPYETPEELMRVSGIGRKTFEEILPFLEIR